MSSVLKKTYFLLDRRSITIPYRYSGQKDPLNALEAVKEQGHIDITTCIIARCTKKRHRGSGKSSSLDRCAKMIESAGNDIAFLGTAQKSVVAGHLM